MDINNLYDFYEIHCKKYPENILFNNSITYSDAFESAAQRAAFLQKEGFKKNDVIGILATSSPEWCTTYMAITMIGAITLPLDINLPAEAYPAMIKTVKAKAFFVSEELKDKLKRVKKYDISADKCLEKKKKVKPANVSEDHIASLLFTSGTTGEPKIVSLSHANIFKTAIATYKFQELNQHDMLLCILPLFHVYALDANFIGPFAAGSSLVFQPSLKGPDIMKSLAENPITIFPAAPQLWELFMDAIVNKVKAESAAKYSLFMFFLRYAPVFRKIGLSFVPDKIFKPVHDIFGHSHRFFISGGAPLKEKYTVYYRNMGFTLIEGYGLTETTGPITMPYYKKNKLGSIGVPMTGNESKVKNVNSEGIGEIWLRGGSVMPGYYKNEAANKEVFDEDGFFNTGDLGRMDRDGYIFLTGRSKNVIVLDSGKNVYPEELESYYKQSDLISEIAVFGRKDDGRETVFAVIVPAEKKSESYNTIKEEINRLNKGLPGYKIISNFAISMDTLPVNSTRKVLYREVEKLLDQDFFQRNEDDSTVLRTVLEGETPEEILIMESVKKKLETDVIYVNETLADHNIDSLGLVDLIVHLEENLSITINPEDLKGLQTMQELLHYLATLEKSDGPSIDQKILNGEITTKPYRFFNPFHHVFLFIFGFISKKFWKVHTINKEKMIFDNHIIVANHQSILDAVWISSEIPAHSRKNVYATGKKKLSFLSKMFPMLPIIFIEHKNSIPALKASADLLRQGKSLIIFPEGTRSRDGKLHEFKTGAAYLAKNLDKKIIPITVNGSYDIFPPGSRFPKFFTELRGNLVIGETIDPNDFRDINSLNKKIFTAIEENLGKK